MLSEGAACLQIRYCHREGRNTCEYVFPEQDTSNARRDQREKAIEQSIRGATSRFHLQDTAYHMWIQRGLAIGLDTSYKWSGYSTPAADGVVQSGSGVSAPKKPLANPNARVVSHTIDIGRVAPKSVKSDDVEKLEDENEIGEDQCQLYATAPKDSDWKLGMLIQPNFGLIGSLLRINVTQFIEGTDQMTHWSQRRSSAVTLSYTRPRNFLEGRYVFVLVWFKTNVGYNILFDGNVFGMPEMLKLGPVWLLIIVIGLFFCIMVYGKFQCADIANDPIEELEFFVQLHNSRAQREHAGCSSSEISSLPLVEWKEFSSQVDNVKCTICLDDFDHRESVKQLPCGHPFHSHCIDTWLYRKRTCPLCLQHIKFASDVHRTELSDLSITTAGFGEEVPLTSGGFEEEVPLTRGEVAN